MAIITAAEYKVYAGVSDSSLDAQLAVIIPAVQAELERYCGRTFDGATFTEYYDGNNASTINLNNFPVASVTSVAVVSVDHASTYYTYATTGYGIELATGILSLYQGADRFVVDPIDDGLAVANNYTRGSTFGRGHRNIKVVYVAGYGGSPYTTMPTDLKALMYRLVGFRLASAKPGYDPSLASERLGDYSYQRATGGLGGSGVSTLLSVFGSEIAAWKRVPL